MDVEAAVFPGEELGDFMVAEEFRFEEGVEELVAEEFGELRQAVIGQAVEVAEAVEKPMGGEDVQVKRVQEMVDSGVSKVALACPFCMVMVQDGLNKVGKEKHIQVVDLAELVQQSM